MTQCLTTHGDKIFYASYSLCIYDSKLWLKRLALAMFDSLNLQQPSFLLNFLIVFLQKIQVIGWFLR